MYKSWAYTYSTGELSNTEIHSSSTGIQQHKNGFILAADNNALTMGANYNKFTSHFYDIELG